MLPVTLEVQDPENAAGSDQVSLNGVPTESPEAQIDTPTADGIYYSDQIITFTGVVSDGEDDATELVAGWESSIDGLLKVEAEPDPDGEVMGYGTLSEGDHAIELQVTDTTGKPEPPVSLCPLVPPIAPPVAASRHLKTVPPVKRDRPFSLRPLWPMPMCPQIG